MKEKKLSKSHLLPQDSPLHETQRRGPSCSPVRGTAPSVARSRWLPQVSSHQTWQDEHKLTGSSSVFTGPFALFESIVSTFSKLRGEKKNQHPTTPQVPNLLFGDISFRRVLLTRTQAAAALRGRGNLQHSRRTPLRDAREGRTTPNLLPTPGEGRGRGWRFPGAKGSSPTASSLFQSCRTPPSPHSMQLFSLCLTPICVLWHYNCCSHRHKQRRFPLQNPHMF